MDFISIVHTMSCLFNIIVVGFCDSISTVQTMQDCESGLSKDPLSGIMNVYQILVQF